MRLRDVAHTPSPASMEYDLGVRKIRLIGGNELGKKRVQARIAEAFGVEPEHDTVSVYSLLLHAFALWDDPDAEFETQADPDDVLDLEGEKLKEICLSLEREVMSPKAVRSGLVPYQGLIVAVTLAMRGLDGAASTGFFHLRSKGDLKP